MNREEVSMVGFEIVAYAGDARSNLIQAIEIARKGNYEEAEKLIEEADESIKEAHNTQTTMLSKEAAGEDLELSFIMMHGQDHLMTTLLLRDLVEHIINIYKEG